MHEAPFSAREAVPAPDLPLMAMACQLALAGPICASMHAGPAER